MIGYLAAFPGARFAVDHAAVVEEAGAAPRVALRWSLPGRHEGRGAFGPPSGAAVLVLGITHMAFRAARVRREWMLIDELALWKKMIAGRTG